MKTKIILTLLALSFAEKAWAGLEALNLQKAFNEAAAHAKPAVVSLKVVREESETVVEPEYFFGYVVPKERTYRHDIQGMGSGFIISSDGYILTNYHVVAEADKIRVSFLNDSGIEKTYIGVLVGGDSTLDLAVLKIQAKEKLPYLEFADSESLKVGDFTLAVGYPFGFKQTVTSGIVSALNAGIKVEGKKYDKLIQTDAAINQGNSGGPLLNIEGKVIGVNSAIISPSGAFAGMGFAISANSVKKVLDALMTGKKVKRSWIGVGIIPLNPMTARRLGIEADTGGLVNVVAKGSPAYEAGIVRGDVIIACDGEPIEGQDDLSFKTYDKRPGEKIVLTCLSNGKKLAKIITLAERPSEENTITYTTGKNDTKEQEKDGLQSWEGVALRFENNGALVEKISRDSKLYGYLKNGDLIKAVNSKKISSAVKINEVFSELDLSEGVVFDLVRNGSAIYVSVQVR